MKVERAKQEAVEPFKTSNAFTQELVSHSGKALENSLKAVRDDLKCLYLDVNQLRFLVSSIY